MFGVEILEREHQNILDMTRVLRGICHHMIDMKDVPVADLTDCIAWIRTYADAHHHGKEEEILFAEMTKHGGPAADKLVGAMLIEHDMGRFHMGELEKALAKDAGDPDALLDAITHASGYAQLLVRHATKEDTVVYPFAQRMLPQEVLDDVDRRTHSFEDATDMAEYEAVLERMKAKYL